MDNIKKTAIQNERQLKSLDTIIQDIIDIFTDNVLSFQDVECILAEISIKLRKHPIVKIDDSVKKVYAMRNGGEAK